tara:strand:- start:540 stop:692 length:153 start_codon:yes stop_codon:yes gene_type:complete
MLAKGLNPEMKRRMMTSVLSVKLNGEFARRTLTTSEKRIRLENLLSSLLK